MRHFHFTDLHRSRILDRYNCTLGLMALFVVRYMDVGPT